MIEEEFRFPPRDILGRTLRKGAMVQAVLFDLFETLITESDSAPRRASSLASQFGVTDAAFRTRWRSLRPDVVVGHCSFVDALARSVRAAGGTPDDRVLQQLRAERLHQKAAIVGALHPRVRETLEALRARRLKLAVISNCFAEDVAAWDRSPFREFFDAVLFSCATGLAKPDPEVYLLACRRLEVPPERALFIGDGGDGELAGARNAGLSACRAVFPFLPLPPRHISQRIVN